MCQVADRPGVQLWLRVDHPANGWLLLDRNEVYRATLDDAVYGVIGGSGEGFEVNNGEINDRIVEIVVAVDPPTMDPENNWLGKCGNHFVTPAGVDKHAEMNFNWEAGTS